MARRMTDDGIAWTGIARRAAEDRVEREHAQNKRVAYALEDLADEYRAAMRGLQPLRDSVHNLLLPRSFSGVT
ncbi:hypothetical protein GCM10011410_29030 [Hoyosella rhizosphaerae]|uniref:Uncharacterized protein n=2 Tax=Hoyosella rhizosphaerae TaxID=1755582 RepID=A0A916XIA8_9ACTN|nr:hypothetical protein GCM10011410_29030 [Hoyosella rhizosphaerae]